MKKWLPIFGILYLTQTLFPSVDSIAVDVASDSIKITHLYASRNCGSIFIFDVTVTDNYIRIFENDTSTAYYDCMCHFDLSVTLSSLPAGDYFVEVFGTSVIYPDDTTFCGSAHFTVPAPKFISHTSSGCHGKSIEQFSSENIPLVSQSNSGCLQASEGESFMSIVFNGDLYLVWKSDTISSDYEPNWQAWLDSDTLYVTADDSNAS